MQLVDVVPVSTNKDFKPFGSRDTRWLSLVAESGRNVVKEALMVAGIADDSFDCLTAMFSG